MSVSGNVKNIRQGNGKILSWTRRAGDLYRSVKHVVTCSTDILMALK